MNSILNENHITNTKQFKKGVIINIILKYHNKDEEDLKKIPYAIPVLKKEMVSSVPYEEVNIFIEVDLFYNINNDKMRTLRGLDINYFNKQLGENANEKYQLEYKKLIATLKLYNDSYYCKKLYIHALGHSGAGHPTIPPTLLENIAAISSSLTNVNQFHIIDWGCNGAKKQEVKTYDGSSGFKPSNQDNFMKRGFITANKTYDNACTFYKIPPNSRSQLIKKTHTGLNIGYDAKKEWPRRIDKSTKELDRFTLTDEGLSFFNKQDKKQNKDIRDLLAGRLFK